MKIFLETERLFITLPTKRDDANWLTLYPHSADEVRNRLFYFISHFEKYGFTLGSLYLKANQVFIGNAGLFYYATPEEIQHDLEMGCHVHKNYWNKGYASEITQALIVFAFTQIGAHKLTALTKNDNQKSQTILQRMGLHYVKNVKADDEEFLLYEINNASTNAVLS